VVATLIIPSYVGFEIRRIMVLKQYGQKVCGKNWKKAGPGGMQIPVTM
jgi:hypothetical protein